jgi:hypothetical protein
VTRSYEPEQLANLFDASTTYSVPPYQRAYSWEEKHLQQFLEDLSEHHPRKPYYLGHFLLERKSEHELYVIDGQQRLSTVVLLMGTICRELAARGLEAEALPIHDRFLKRDGRFRFATVRDDVDLFVDLVLKGSSKVPVASRSQERIDQACELLHRNLKDLETDALRSMVTVLSKAHVTRMVVADKVQATQIFTLQNSRGKDLTELEKLKAYLMYQVYLHSENEGENAAIASIESQFERIYTTAERLRYSGEDQVLSYHDQAYSPHSEGGPVDHLKHDLSDLSDLKTSSEVVDHVTDYCKMLAASFSHAESLEKLLSHHDLVADLVILGGAEVWPLLIKLYAGHGETLIHDLALQEMLRNAEITLLKFKFLHGRSVNHLTKYAKILGTQHYTMKWLCEQMKLTVTYGYRTGDSFNQAFMDYLNGDNHYRPESRYILWKYENHIRHPKDDEVSPGDFLSEVAGRRMESTIEHIASQTPGDGSHTQEFANKCLNNMGNFLFMPKGLNSSLGNRPPEEKAAILATVSYKSHRDAAADILKPCEKGCDLAWCDHKVQTRKQSIIDFALRRWQAN